MSTCAHIHTRARTHTHSCEHICHALCTCWGARVLGNNTSTHSNWCNLAWCHTLNQLVMLTSHTEAHREITPQF